MVAGTLFFEACDCADAAETCVSSAAAQTLIEKIRCSRIAEYSVVEPGVGNPPRSNGYESTMDLIRRYSLLFTAVVLALAVAIGAIVNRPAVSANAAGALARSASYFDSTIVLARA